MMAAIAETSAQLQLNKATQQEQGRLNRRMVKLTWSQVVIGSVVLIVTVLALTVAVMAFMKM